MLDIFFPFSYIGIAIGLLIGVGIGSILIGGFTVAIICIMIWLGMIRITPLIDFLQRICTAIFPDQILAIKRNIRESFKIRGELKPGKYIYMWHPHGLFAYSQFLHIGTDLTVWPEHLRNVQGTALAALFSLPFVGEISEKFGGVPTEYHAMKNVLVRGKSLSLAPGGMREVLYKDLTTILKKRRGIFKMALETGTPLVPVLSIGENEIFSSINLPSWIQDILEPYDMCITIPSLKTFVKWYRIMTYPLKNPVISVLGQPLPVKQIENPTKKDIDDLREKYIIRLKELCKSEGVEIKII
jgi:hypothetical protein